MQAEAVAEGHALRGVITSVEDVDPGRRLEPIWTISVTDEAPLRVREGSRLCVAGLPKRSASVRSIERAAPGKLEVQVEITGWKKKPKDGPRGVLAADDVRLVGTAVTLVPDNMEGFFRLKSRKAWQNATPGSWLTHSRPAGRGAELPEEVGEDINGLQKKLGK
jgi:hypothetical protein